MARAKASRARYRLVEQRVDSVGMRIYERGQCRHVGIEQLSHLAVIQQCLYHGELLGVLRQL